MICENHTTVHGLLILTLPYVSVRVDTFMTSGLFDPLPPCHVQISRKLVTLAVLGAPNPLRTSYKYVPIRVWKGRVYPRARARPEAPRMREHATIPNPF